MEREMDEISLREIIDIVWSGKWIIALVTFLAVAISGVVSFFVLDPVYEARSTIMINNQQVSDEIPQLSMQTYVEQVKNHAIMRKVIDDLNLDEEDITINALREKVSVEIVKDTNLVRLAVKDKDPKLAAEITNVVSSYFVTLMTDQSIQQLKNSLEYQIKRIDEDITLKQISLENIQQELGKTPETLVTSNSLSEDAYLHSVVSGNANTSNAEAGGIQMKNEHLNPLYISLQQSESNIILDISNLINKKEVIQEKIQNNELIILENLQIVSPGIEPEEPVGPRKLLNVAIAGVVGGMISLFIVFLMEYWRNSATGSSVYRRTNDQNANISV